MSAALDHEESLFKTNDDYLVWANYIRRCDTLEGLNPAEKEAAKNSLSYLSRAFGEHFLRRAYEQREHKALHPLVQTIVMQAAWSRLWLIRFAQALQSLETAPNFKGLLKRLRNPERFAEGESVLKVAGQLLNAGFDVSFDPQVSVRRRDGNVRLKKPDIKIVSGDTGEAIVEVSLLGQNEGFQKAQELASFVIPLLFNHLSPAGLEMYAQMNERFDESRVTSTVNELLALIEQVRQTKKFAALENDCILAGIAPREDIEALDQWADEQAVSKAISGPPAYSDELARAVMKIRDKLAQLPENLPGIIVIPTTGSALFHRYTLDSIIRTLADEISRYPKLLCVILTHGYFGGTGQKLPTALVGDHAIASRSLGNLLNEQAVVLINASSKFAVSTLIDKLRGAFVYSDL